MVALSFTRDDIVFKMVPLSVSADVVKVADKEFLVHREGEGGGRKQENKLVNPGVGRGASEGEVGRGEGGRGEGGGGANHTHMIVYVGDREFPVSCEAAGKEHIDVARRG